MLHLHIEGSVEKVMGMNKLSFKIYFYGMQLGDQLHLWDTATKRSIRNNGHHLSPNFIPAVH